MKYIILPDEFLRQLIIPIRNTKNIINLRTKIIIPGTVS